MGFDGIRASVRRFDRTQIGSSDDSGVECVVVGGQNQRRRLDGALTTAGRHRPHFSRVVVAVGRPAARDANIDVTRAENANTQGE